MALLINGEPTNTFVANNIGELRELAAQYNVKFPDGPGRPPIKAIESALRAAHGDHVTLDISNYSKAKDVAAVVTSAVVSASVPTGKGNGRVPRKLTVDSTQARAVSGKAGKLPLSAFITAAAVEWKVDAAELRSVKVDGVEFTAKTTFVPSVAIADLEAAVAEDDKVSTEVNEIIALLDTPVSESEKVDA